MQEGEENFRVLFDSAPDAYYLSDTNGNFIDGNPAAERISGHKREELIGSNFLKKGLLSANQIPKAAKLLLRNKTGLSTGPDKFTLMRKDNSKVSVEIRTRPIQIQDKRVVLGMVRDITELTKAEQALRDSEKQYRLVLDDSPGLVDRFLPDGTITFVNKEYCRFFGKKPDELIGTKIQSHILEEEREEVFSAITSLTEKSPTQTSENKVIKDNDEIHWVRWTNCALFDEKGRVSSYHSFGQDITERVRAEQALRESEEQYRSVVEDSPGVICRFLPDGTITFVNKEYCKFFGKKQTELIGTNIQSTIPEEIRENVMLSIASLNAESPVITFENKNIIDEKQNHWMRWTDRALFDDEGKIISIQSFGQDITEIKEAEHALKQEQERAQQYLDIAELIILALDRKDEITLINQKGSQILGYQEDELIGKNWFDTCVPMKIRNDVKQVFMAIMSGKEESVKYFENLVETDTGAERTIGWHNTVIRDDNGHITGTLSSGEDITERKQTEEHVKYISFHDMMTNTYNRTYFEVEMKRLEKSRSNPISIIVADVNNLKAINDKYGHQAGDTALKNIAEIIKNCFRPDDVVARIGGDEFAVLMLRSDSNVAQEACKRIYTKIDDHNKRQDLTIPLSISIGWATAKSGKTLDKAFKTADENMYEKKQTRQSGKERN